MDTQELLDKYSPLLKQYAVPLILVTLGLIYLGYGLITFNKSGQDKQDILTDSAQDQAQIVKSVKKAQADNGITVDIEGAVIRPGVYKLGVNSRVQDGLIAAGGLSEKADRFAVSKNFNLATKLTDGAKLYLPFSGEQVLSSAGQNVLSAQSGSVNINDASVDELDGLPGIGTVTAQKILSGRPYQSIDELLQKKIVGRKVFDQIKEKISVN